ncbi:PspA/IM30 family protein [Nodosilinea sp. P-1105]|uniref:PspA/IM30 family protein n=1 Tax=Nodosilinea sp. P-1105 TaxID=2546229 RepID=UPI00146DDED8|nr:PspA/IM30 family protein [Nodosilinea sp. P-1105]NMF83782.1 PspA/IM30 family protein [Nodosilinea sp. P-1105]
MGLLDRAWRALRANLTGLVNDAEDPEKVLEQALADMQTNLIQLRQAVAQAIATQKRTERQSAQAKSTAKEWYNRAELALQEGSEDLARQALARRQGYLESAQAMDAQIGEQQQVVTKLKDNMRRLEVKIAEAKTKKDLYIARARSAEASQRIQDMIGQTGTNSSMVAFERMEERVMDLEAKAEALEELSGDPLERQFAALENNHSPVDNELAAMKARLLAGGED